MKKENKHSKVGFFCLFEENLLYIVWSVGPLIFTGLPVLYSCRLQNRQHISWNDTCTYTYLVQPMGPTQEGFSLDKAFLSLQTI